MKFVSSGSSLSRRLIQGTLSFLIASGTSQTIGLVVSVLCARILDREGFGELSMVRTTVLMFGVLAGTGLGMAATKFVAESRDIDRLRAGRRIGLLMNIGLITGAGATLLCAVMAGPLATYVLGVAHLSEALMAGAVMLLFNTLNGVQLGVLSGLERFRQVAQLTIWDGVLSLLLVPAGAWVWGVNGAITGSAVASVIAFPIKRYWMHQACEASGILIQYRGVSEEASLVRRFVLPAVFVGLSAQPFDWLASAILVRGPNGYAELGFFAVANTWAQLILFLPGQISGPTQPILANLVGNGQREQVKHILTRVTLIVAATGMMIGLLVAISSNFIVSIYGSGYDAASGPLAILALSSIFCAISAVFKNFLFACGRVWSVVWAHLTMDIVLCSMVWILQARGANGLAFAYVCGWCALLLYEIVASASCFKAMTSPLPLARD